jgi:hypothetical protein
MRKEFCTLDKIIKKEGGKIIEIKKKDRMGVLLQLP